MQYSTIQSSKVDAAASFFATKKDGKMVPINPYVIDRKSEGKLNRIISMSGQNSCPITAGKLEIFKPYETIEDCFLLGKKIVHDYSNNLLKIEDDPLSCIYRFPAIYPAEFQGEEEMLKMYSQRGGLACYCRELADEYIQFTLTLSTFGLEKALGEVRDVVASTGRNFSTQTSKSNLGVLRNLGATVSIGYVKKLFISFRLMEGVSDQYTLEDLIREFQKNDMVLVCNNVNSGSGPASAGRLKFKSLEKAVKEGVLDTLVNWGDEIDFDNDFPLRGT